MFNQIQISFEKLYGKVSGWINEFILALPNILIALLFLTLSYFVAKYLKKGVHRAMKQLTSNRTVTQVVANIVVAAFMVISLFVVLNILNLSDAVTALLGTAGVIGLAVGLALQDPLINLFSGVMMSVREKYNIGDLVDTNGAFGTIQKITLRSTIIRTPNGQEVVIPNKDVVQNPLINYTRSHERRIDVECGVSYGDDLRKVKNVVREAIMNSDIPLKKDKPVEVFFKEFGGSSINFVLRFWCDSTNQGDFFAARDTAVILIKEAFDKNDITIPFPITTLDFGIQGGVRMDELKMFKSMKNGN